MWWRRSQPKQAEPTWPSTVNPPKVYAFWPANTAPSPQLLHRRPSQPPRQDRRPFRPPRLALRALFEWGPAFSPTLPPTPFPPPTRPPAGAAPIATSLSRQHFSRPTLLQRISTPRLDLLTTPHLSGSVPCFSLPSPPSRGPLSPPLGSSRPSGTSRTRRGTGCNTLSTATARLRRPTIPPPSMTTLSSTRLPAGTGPERCTTPTPLTTLLLLPAVPVNPATPPSN